MTGHKKQVKDMIGEKAQHKRKSKPRQYKPGDKISQVETSQDMTWKVKTCQGH
jgi:hypothetical protein